MKNRISTRSRAITPNDRDETEKNRPLQKIGVIGGTFDPIHYGHLFAAEEAGAELGLDRVIFMPSGIPPHKSYKGMASSEQRYEMTLLAISTLRQDCLRNTTSFDISRIEIERGGKSYTLDTLLAVKEEFPDSEIYFIVGMDAILDIMLWHEPFRIAEAAKLAVIGRPGYNSGKIAGLPREIRDSTTVIDSLHLDISGSELRRRIADGRSVRFLLPDSVYAYIRMKNLYNFYKHSEGDSRC